MKLYRIMAFTTRHLYLYKRSLPRLMEIFYWPFLDLVLWGFVTIYLVQFKWQLPNFVAFFLGALILWDILFRSQEGISVSFLEDMWARNILNIFVTPIGPMEYIVSLMLVSIVKLASGSLRIGSLASFICASLASLMGCCPTPLIANLV